MSDSKAEEQRAKLPFTWPYSKGNATGGVGALGTQVGGNHYKDMPIQPAEYCHKNNIGKLEGDVIAYVSRWRKKNGIEDLKKARHTLDLLIELEEARP